MLHVSLAGMKLSRDERSCHLTLGKAAAYTLPPLGLLRHTIMHKQSEQLLARGRLQMQWQLQMHRLLVTTS
jgi:hypothetical protein